MDVSFDDYALLDDECLSSLPQLLHSMQVSTRTAWCMPAPKWLQLTPVCCPTTGASYCSEVHCISAASRW